MAPKRIRAKDKELPEETAVDEPEPVVEKANLDPDPAPVPDTVPDTVPESYSEPSPPVKKKRPQNAYMRFYQSELKKEEYRGTRVPERAKKIGALWQTMDEEQRAPYKITTA